MQKEVVNWSEFTGRTAAVNLVNVTARVNGYIVSIPFKEGDIVHKGDLLYQIDLRPFQDAYAESFIPWDTFAQSVTEAQQLSLAEDLDFLQRTERTRCHCRRTFQAQTLAKKNRRELKGLVEGDSNGETVKATSCQDHLGSAILEV